jgi:hypothetical protein
VYIYRLLHKWGFKPKLLQKRFVNTTASAKEKKKFKRVKQIVDNKKSDWNIIVQDESIFVYDYVIRRKKWISKNKRPIVTVTGSRKKTIVFGCLSLDKTVIQTI